MGPEKERILPDRMPHKMGADDPDFHKKDQAAEKLRPEQIENKGKENVDETE
jgi:hypothetical protein